MMQSLYKTAGVDIGTGESVKADIKQLARSTHGSQVLHGIGLFSGFYELDATRYRHPVLVSSTDGVGTKVKIAEMAGTYQSIGEDLVNHCINDIAVCGADPLYFMDYIAADKLHPETVKEIIAGLAKACKAADCALIGGETAEMPGVYAPGNFDLAGSITGMVEKDTIIDGGRVAAGDLLLGVESNGLHTNGYSLVRQVFFHQENYSLDRQLPDAGTTLGSELLRVHRSYLPLIQTVRHRAAIHGISHITGGGIESNTKRLLRPGLELQIEWQSWQRQAIFNIIAEVGRVAEQEMRQVFNLGIGLVLVIDPAAADNVRRECDNLQYKNWVIGSVKAANGG